MAVVDIHIAPDLFRQWLFTTGFLVGLVAGLALGVYFGALYFRRFNHAYLAFKAKQKEKEKWQSFLDSLEFIADTGIYKSKSGVYFCGKCIINEAKASPLTLLNSKGFYSCAACHTYYESPAYKAQKPLPLYGHSSSVFDDM